MSAANPSNSIVTFFAEITEDAVLSDNKPITYAHYLENVKPKPESKPQNKVVYVCRICGYVYEGDPLPEDFVCPLCKHGAEDFDRVEQGESKAEQKEEKPSSGKNQLIQKKKVSDRLKFKQTDIESKRF